jgi:hypothetical protein
MAWALMFFTSLDFGPIILTYCSSIVVSIFLASLDSNAKRSRFVPAATEIFDVALTVIALLHFLKNPASALGSSGQSLWLSLYNGLALL